MSIMSELFMQFSDNFIVIELVMHHSIVYHGQFDSMVQFKPARTKLAHNDVHSQKCIQFLGHFLETTQTEQICVHEPWTNNLSKMETPYILEGNLHISVIFHFVCLQFIFIIQYQTPYRLPIPCNYGS